MKWNLVYFDDQVQNLEAFTELLADDFKVIGCNDATAYSRILEENNPHAILLDVHMPVLDGHTLYKEISQHPLYNGCPVIFISGDQSDENILKSYSGGGIDFFSRTISTDEMVIRLTNKIKFFMQISTALDVGNLTLDVKTMKSEINGSNVDLTLVELRMLCNIFRSYPDPLTRTELIQKVWGSNSTVKPGTISTHLTNLKPKIVNWNYQIKVRDENILIQKK